MKGENINSNNIKEINDIVKTNNIIKLIDILLNGTGSYYELEELYNDFTVEEINPQTEIYINYPKLHKILSKVDSSNNEEDSKIRVKQFIVNIYWKINTVISAPNSYLNK
jgi:hypothetical protein